MRYIFDNDLHIHSKISTCSRDPEQTNERILRYAKENALTTICLTDHFWDEGVPGAIGWYQEKNFAHILAARPLPQEEGIRFLFGCETEIDRHLTLGITREVIDRLDFVVIPTTHLHFMGFTIAPEDDTPERRAELWVQRLESLLSRDLPFEKIGIAHPTCRLLAGSKPETFSTIINLLRDDDVERLFTRAAVLGCGIELNQGDMAAMLEDPDTVARIYQIAKRVGCKFYCASDAHHPGKFATTKAIFEQAIDLLGLTEDDKFHLVTTA